MGEHGNGRGLQAWDALSASKVLSQAPQIIKRMTITLAGKNSKNVFDLLLRL